ncbi:MAG: DEAD/DEAH box helicase [Anaerolineae bacterium]|nr:DEAD/DEAH box helicase [Anaerolineae bacterium]MDK1119540.1 DEAD/DEAH box helicase [Anaerolineae bacterium]
MTTEFDSLNLHPQLVQALTERGYITPTPIQAGLIPLMLSGADVIGQAQTGTGKTAAFALPILQNLEPDNKLPQALILVPTRELAIQVADAFYEYGVHLGARVLAVYGGAPYGRQITRLNKGVEIVVATPGRLIDLLKRGAINLRLVKTVVLDEADEMLNMGFIEDVETILSETPETRQTALFSATLPKPIRRLAEKYMREPESVTIQREQVTAEMIEQRCYLVNERDKMAALTRLYEVEDVTSALIFVRTRVRTGELANELTVRGFAAEALNGDLSQDARERTLRRFRNKQIKVLVATDVAARGLDIDDISHVFNYDLPDDPEMYVHRVGRTGRAGKTGLAITLVTPRQKNRLASVERFTHQKFTFLPLPTETDIEQRRENDLREKINIWLQRGRYKRELEIVNELVEAGTDPLELAAVALKMARASEKQRPIAAISEVKNEEPKKRKFDRGGGRKFGRNRHRRGERSDRRSKVSHEQDMVRVTFSLGRADGIRPADVVGTIAHHANIPGHSIGKIFIEDKHTIVDVSESMADKVLSKNVDYKFKRQSVSVEKV